MGTFFQQVWKVFGANANAWADASTPSRDAFGGAARESRERRDDQRASERVQRKSSHRRGATEVRGAIRVDAPGACCSTRIPRRAFPGGAFTLSP